MFCFIFAPVLFGSLALNSSVFFTCCMKKTPFGIIYCIDTICSIIGLVDGSGPDQGTDSGWKEEKTAI